MCAGSMQTYTMSHRDQLICGFGGIFAPVTLGYPEMTALFSSVCIMVFSSLGCMYYYNMVYGIRRFPKSPHRDAQSEETLSWIMRPTFVFCGCHSWDGLLARQQSSSERSALWA
jgi:hypothetical protein